MIGKKVLTFKYRKKYNMIEYLSFIDPERGVFGEIFPEVMIFSVGFSWEISSLKKIFR